MPLSQCIETPPEHSRQEKHFKIHLVSTEDNAHRYRDEIQKITDEFSEKVDELAEIKEAEIMEV